MAQDGAGLDERLANDRPAAGPERNAARDAMSNGSEVLRKSRSGLVDWGTGGFEFRGERTRSGRKLANIAPPGRQWQRTNAAAFSFWDNLAPGIAFEAGARLEQTKSGVAGGPLLTIPTSSETQMAYVGAQIGSSVSVRLVGFDNGGWSEGASRDLINRIAIGEAPARKGAAIEIGKFISRSGNAGRDPQLKLQLERATTATGPDTSVAISWKVHF